MLKPAALVFSFLLAVPALAAPLPKVPPGFKVELVLQAPAIEAPTALCVAPNGDVYFAEDPMDMVGPPTKPADRIWLLKGGDPKKKVLIADKMWAVMGLEIVRDKLYVVHAPHVTVFTLDAEGKPKKREELFDDLGPKVAGVPSFNDHIPSGIRMGMDGWLYVSVGDKGIPHMTRKEKDGGSEEVFEGQWRHKKEGHYISLEGGGVIRFRPDGTGLEVFASGTRNHLDVPMDAQDRIFVRDNTDDGDGWNTRFMYITRRGFYGYPWAFKKHPKETLPMIHDFGGGSPCGGWVYEDDGLPETYRGRVFHCEWGQGKVYAVKIAPDGAGFKFVDQITFMDPDKVKDFRPFTLRPTADGRGFYVTDWGYNGWLNPKKAGRIWKVTYTRDDIKPQPRGKDTDSVEQLVKALNHPAFSERLRAQRELIARIKAAKKLNKDIIEGPPAKVKLSAVAMRHVLWIMKETGEPSDWIIGFAALAASGKEEVTVKLQAARLVDVTDPYWKGRRLDCWGGVAVLGGLYSLLNDSDPQVRLHAAQNILIPLDHPEMILSVMKQEKDPWVRYAIVKSLKRNLGNRWNRCSAICQRLLEHLQEEKTPRDQAPEKDIILSALTEEYDVEALELLKKFLADKDPRFRQRAVEALSRVYHDRKPYAGTWWGTRPEQQKPPARVVPWAGTPVVRKAILQALADKNAGVRKAAVEGLLAMKDPETLDPLIRQFEREKDLATRLDIVRAVSGINSERTESFLVKLTREEGIPESLQMAAITGLENIHPRRFVQDIAPLIDPKHSVAVQEYALRALASSKTPLARQTCVANLQNANAGIRKAALLTLAKIGDRDTIPSILPLLRDRDLSVRTAGIQALGNLHAREAVPALVRAAADRDTQFEAITALAKMPDKRALSAYLTGLVSRNADLRQASRQALQAVREKVAPALEQLVKANEIRPELLPELRSVYTAFTPILAWRVIGPFHNDGKAYPPEKELKFDAVYTGSDKQVRWQPVRGDAGKHGKVDLAHLLSPNVNVVAYAYAEVESSSDRDAQLLVGSDDSIFIWLNGRKVFEFPGDRGWNYDQDKVNVHLKKGKNALLVKCGQHGGPWEFSVAVSGEADRYAFLKGGARKLDLNVYRAYALSHPGDPERGRKLFLDTKGLACVKCHSVAGQGGTVGPDLAGIALKYRREDLITSVLEPSKVIAQGYETIVISTTKGKLLTGVYKGETADAVHLMDKDGQKITVPKKDIDERSFSSVSVMPNGLNEGMTLQDFADIIAFLEARRERKPAAMDPKGAKKSGKE